MKKLRIVSIIIASALCLAIISGTVLADSFASLNELRQQAWKGFDMTFEIQSSYQATDILDGAVLEDGTAKVCIESWNNVGIPKSSDGVVFYKYEESKEEYGKLYEDTIVSVENKIGDRLEVRLGSLTGYVSADSLLVGQEAKERADSLCPEMVISDEMLVNIRRTADTGAEVLGMMEQRKTYSIIDETEGWTCIDYNGAEGWVSNDNIKRVRIIHAMASNDNSEDPRKDYEVMPITDEDRIAYAALIFCEANSESFEGKQVVASVILNRVYSKDYPGTISEVINSENQFEPVTTGWHAQVVSDPSQITDSCYEAVDSILQGQDKWEDYLFFSTSDIGDHIGNHYFK